MPNKVIHVPDTIHRQAKAFCKQHGLQMSAWVSDLILRALGIDPESDPVPVKRGKPLSRLTDSGNGEEAGADEPFWSGKHAP